MIKKESMGSFASLSQEEVVRFNASLKNFLTFMFARHYTNAVPVCLLQVKSLPCAIPSRASALRGSTACFQHQTCNIPLNISTSRIQLGGLRVVPKSFLFFRSVTSNICCSRITTLAKDLILIRLNAFCHTFGPRHYWRSRG